MKINDTVKIIFEMFFIVGNKKGLTQKARPFFNNKDYTILLPQMEHLLLLHRQFDFQFVG